MLEAAEAVGILHHHQPPLALAVLEVEETGGDWQTAPTV